MNEIKVSWTGLRRYEECHHKHYQVKKGNSMPVWDGRVFLPGQIVDRTVTWWLNQDEPQMGQMKEYGPELLRKYTDPRTDEEKANPDRYAMYKWRGNPETDRAKVLQMILDSVARLETLLEKYVLPYDWRPAVRFETPIIIPGRNGQMGIYLIGEFDIVVRVSRDPERFLIIDVKVTEDTGYIRKTLGQSVFYDIGFGHWWGNTAQPDAFAFFFPLLDHQVQYVKITEDERNVMMGRVIRMAQGMAAGEWEPKADNAGCDWCEVHHVCPKFTLDVVRDEQGKNRVSFEKAAARRPRREGDGLTTGSAPADQTA